MVTASFHASSTVTMLATGGPVEALVEGIVEVLAEGLAEALLSPAGAVLVAVHEHPRRSTAAQRVMSA